MNDLMSAKPSDKIVSSMVHGALQNVEEKGTSPDESWMTALKEAAATAFLGMWFVSLVKSYLLLFPFSQLPQRQCVISHHRVIWLPQLNPKTTVKFGRYDLLPSNDGKPGYSGEGSSTD